MHALPPQMTHDWLALTHGAKIPSLLARGAPGADVPDLLQLLVHPALVQRRLGLALIRGQEDLVDGVRV